MTERSGSHSAGPASAGPAAKAGGRHEAEERPGLVVRDRRRIDPNGGKTSKSGSSPAVDVEDVVGEQPGPAEDEVVEASGAAGRDDDAAERVEVVDATADEGTGTEVLEGTPVEVPAAFGAELEALRGELDERTRDLQRISAEYANYRKRVDRDRGLVLEQATGAVLAALLPVLDDLDRAREHGDLVGPFSSVAEQLSATTGKFGLTPFGEKGDPFDPTRHEAVTHLTSAEVTEPTCVEVLRRGYLLGERLLRPALVAVADPAD